MKWNSSPAGAVRSSCTRSRWCSMTSTSRARRSRQVDELHGVDGREAFAEPALLQNVGDPVREVVGWLGIQVLVLHQEVVRVVEHDRQRHGAQVLEQPGQVGRLPPGELGQRQAGPELEW